MGCELATYFHKIIHALPLKQGGKLSVTEKAYSTKYSGETDHHESVECGIKPKHSINNHPAGNKVFSASISLCITATAAKERTITAKKIL